MWQQAITPNYKIPYYGGLCEGFVEGTVGQATKPYKDKNGNYTTSGVFPSASAAWNSLQGKHPGEQPPEGVMAALYFTLGNNKYGHTALSLGDGRIASSTQSGYHETAYIHQSLQDLINTYAKYNGSCMYLGWTEYIGNLQVVKGEDMAYVPDDVLRDLLDWKEKGIDAQKYKDALLASKAWTGDINEKLDNVTPVLDDLQQFKSDSHSDTKPVSTQQLKPGIYEVL